MMPMPSVTTAGAPRSVWVAAAAALLMRAEPTRIACSKA